MLIVCFPWAVQSYRPIISLPILWCMWIAKILQGKKPKFFYQATNQIHSLKKKYYQNISKEMYGRSSFMLPLVSAGKELSWCQTLLKMRKHDGTLQQSYIRILSAIKNRVAACKLTGGETQQFVQLSTASCFRVNCVCCLYNPKMLISLQFDFQFINYISSE